MHRFLGRESVQGVTFLVGTESEETAAVRVRMRAAIELLARKSPRTLARLRRGPRYILLAPAGNGVAFDPATRATSLDLRTVAHSEPERVAVMLGVGAASARFGWMNFRPSPDERAQMFRRFGIEGRALLVELGASYPTREWFRRWMPTIPPSPREAERTAEAVSVANKAPRWLLRALQFFLK